MSAMSSSAARWCGQTVASQRRPGIRTSGWRCGDIARCSRLALRASTQRQPYVVLGEGQRRGRRRREVFELGELTPAVEFVVHMGTVEHGRDPPRETLHL